jgi:nitroimidazol reductase NimA-like FMN-containing flavoprotein (pyridoxamine 5'-phosphate oxidase superfamily)
MEKDEVDALIQRQILCRIAFRGSKYPYIVPFQYTAIDGTLYFHFTDYGKKMKLLKASKSVCVEIEEYAPDLSEFRFATLRGKLKVVTDKGERAKAMAKLANDGERRLSRKFLAAHGFSEHEDWSSLNSEKSMALVKLDDIVEMIGLKSP